MAASGRETVNTIIAVPNALISWLIDSRSMARICVGTVSMPVGFQKGSRPAIHH